MNSHPPQVSELACGLQARLNDAQAAATAAATTRKDLEKARARGRALYAER